MKNKNIDFSIALLSLISLLVIILNYQNLPFLIPTYWSLHGEILGVGQKWILFLPFAAMLICNFLFSLSNKLNFKTDIEFQNIYHAIRLLVNIYFVIFISLMIINSYNQSTIIMNRIFPILFVSIFLVIGCFIPQCKPNYFLGIRTPWTLANQIVWDKTHMFTGPIWIFCGLLSITMFMFFPLNIAIAVFYLCLCLMVLIPLIYSYIIYIQNTDGKDIIKIHKKENE